ncbi:hypothetical protein [Marinobacterium arenosum]|uniref:hypothetical protein n=1 Tax=Marinobacterium arenosum TaxID=2862496 RepID=UPI001C97E356|nr:hypothetical protein [Marinobacterium arenosum]MBY4675472.1 hypothetical protein [Marinobacterium arenosum]
MPDRPSRLQAMLQRPPYRIPDEFSVVASHQLIPQSVLDEVDRFIETFERVTTRKAWIDTVLQQAPESARQRRAEVCFFSAWDLHLPENQPADWKLIEFNDNGSGFLFAAQINRLYFEQFLSDTQPAVAEPLRYPQFYQLIGEMIAQEAALFFGSRPDGLLLILDDQESLERGKFRSEHRLLADIAQADGWQSAIASPERLEWAGDRLRVEGSPVALVVNRSTDFFWQDARFSALLEAYRSSRVYVAPNPFSYATRSDKQLLQYLSRPDWDLELGIEPDERTLLNRHLPASYRLSRDNLDQLAATKEELVFKPCHGHAGLGVLDRQQVGRHRLQRLLAKGHCYMAQQIAPKSRLLLSPEQPLWCDLRVWAYRGRRYQISGRASRNERRLDLQPPGGWLPTLAATG